MKKSLLLFAMGALAFACSGDSTTTPVNEGNKVLLLKVDLLTNAFEGGKELVFPENENFTISSDYNPPGDFGDITLSYDEVAMPIFAGTIICMGTGEITYPEQMDAIEEFAINQVPVQMPPVSGFVKVSYGESDAYYYPEEIDYEAIWDAVDNLELVKQYREDNPDGAINLFLYTPSVGIGDPAEWDWIVIIKN